MYSVCVSTSMFCDTWVVFFVETISIEWQTNWPHYYYIIWIECSLSNKKVYCLKQIYVQLQRYFLHALYTKIHINNLGSSILLSIYSENTKYIKVVLV